MRIIAGSCLALATYPAAAAAAFASAPQPGHRARACVQSEMRGAGSQAIASQAIARCGAPRCAWDPDMPSFEITLQKPLGIAFGEKAGGGLQVDEMLPEGSAAADGTAWPRDLLLEVNGGSANSTDG